MEKDDRYSTGENGDADAGYEPPKAEELDTADGPAVTSAGATVTGTFTEMPM